MWEFSVRIGQTNKANAREILCCLRAIGENLPPCITSVSFGHDNNYGNYKSEQTNGVLASLART